MKKLFIILIHLGYWALYLLLLAVVFLLLGTQNQGRWPGIGTFLETPIGVVALLPNLLAFYSLYLIVFPRFLKRRRIAFAAATGIVFAAASAFAAMFAAYLYSGSRQPVFESPNEFLGLAGALFGVAAIHGAIGLVIRGFIEWYGDLKLKEELARKTHEMELSLVRAQMDPHFLFNTLSNIDVLISKDSAKASEYLGKLSDIMRFMTYETRAEFIPLADELSYIEKYIALQKIRMSDPEKVSFTVTSSPESHSVAPMIFIPFIENAFKHVGKGKIEVGFDLNETEINFTCRNAYKLEEREGNSPGGIGSELIKRRLELLYPGRHELEIADADGEYYVRLKIV